MLELKELPSYEINFKIEELSNIKLIPKYFSIFLIFNKQLNKVIYVGYAHKLRSNLYKIINRDKLYPVDNYLIYYCFCNEELKELKKIKSELKEAYMTDDY